MIRKHLTTREVHSLSIPRSPDSLSHFENCDPNPQGTSMFSPCRLKSIQ